MSRLFILVILTACIVTILAMTTNRSSMVPESKPRELDWPPLVFVQQTPETNAEKTQRTRNRKGPDDLLQSLAALASRSRELKKFMDDQVQIHLGKPEPIYQTVHVPFFKNDTSRQGPETDLTRLVANEIEVRTPLRLVFSPERADSEIQGRIFYQEQKGKIEKAKKRIPLPNILTLEFTWRDLRQGKILVERRFVTTDLRNMKKSKLTLLNDRTLEEMAKKVVDVIVEEGGKVNWLQQ
jgi:hypothetical protein